MVADPRAALMSSGEDTQEDELFGTGDINLDDIETFGTEDSRRFFVPKEGQEQSCQSTTIDAEGDLFGSSTTEMDQLETFGMEGKTGAFTTRERKDIPSAQGTGLSETKGGGEDEKTVNKEEDVTERRPEDDESDNERNEILEHDGTGTDSDDNALVMQVDGAADKPKRGQSKKQPASDSASGSGKGRNDPSQTPPSRGRGRGRPSRGAASATPTEQDKPVATSAPKGRGRGRPPKRSQSPTIPVQKDTKESAETTLSSPKAVSRGRGRPRKTPAPPVSVAKESSSDEFDSEPDTPRRVTRSAHVITGASHQQTKADSKNSDITTAEKMIEIKEATKATTLQSTVPVKSITPNTEECTAKHTKEKSPSEKAMLDDSASLKPESDHTDLTGDSGSVDNPVQSIKQTSPTPPAPSAPIEFDSSTEDEDEKLVIDCEETEKRIKKNLRSGQKSLTPSLLSLENKSNAAQPPASPQGPASPEAPASPETPASPEAPASPEPPASPETPSSPEKFLTPTRNTENMSRDSTSGPKVIPLSPTHTPERQGTSQSPEIGKSGDQKNEPETPESQSAEAGHEHMSQTSTHSAMEHDLTDDVEQKTLPDESTSR